jgi:putative ABC transport system permease protein
MDINNELFKKFKVILTLSGIVIGITTALILIGSVSGMTLPITSQTEPIKGDIIIVQEGQILSASPTAAPDEKRISSETVSKIKHMPLLFDFKEYTAFPLEINGKMIIVEGRNDWSTINIENGTPGVVIDQDIVNNFGYKIGSKIKIKDKELTVTGIAATSNRLIYIDINKALPMTNNELTMITARTNGDPKIVSEEMKDQIKGANILTKDDIVIQLEPYL